MPARARSRPLLALLLFVGVVGSISTALWIGAGRAGAAPASVASASVLLALAACVALTSLNLAVRWLRWHFLIRRYTRRLMTRDSLAVYLATLPAIVTPFFVGELVRVLILRRKSGVQTSHLAWVWLIERGLDAGVMLAFLCLATSPRAGVAALVLLAVATFAAFRFLLQGRDPRSVARVGSAALVATAVAWLLPIAALALTLRLAGTALGFDAVVRAFATGTLLGGATGLPLGVSVVGSTMIRELQAAGVALDVGVLAVLVHRIGTAWYAVFLGVASFLFARRRLAGIVRDEVPDHFDHIAHEYEELIPRHVRDRLLAKKTGLIRRQLERLGVAPGALGLDLGCGQGWYLAELARAGHVVYGVDAAQGQLAQAAAHLERDRIPHGHLLRSDMTSLPFPDASFDFVYSINAMHHLADPDAQRRALREIVRVLRPRGAFVLHEINTANPVFRLYVGYVFPLLKQIDEGTEHWILPWDLPAVPGADWQPDVEYLTFTPDFAPAALQPLLDRVERRLERSRLRHLSAHYQACLIKK